MKREIEKDRRRRGGDKKVLEAESDSAETDRIEGGKGGEVSRKSDGGQTKASGRNDMRSSGLSPARNARHITH